VGNGSFRSKYAEEFPKKRSADAPGGRTALP
jgi:hypothetical protein